MISADSIIDDILVREGGYVNHPADRGGPTKHGVTLATLTDWRGKETDHADVANLTEKEARAIYHNLYIIQPGFLTAGLTGPLLAICVDCAVNHGPMRAVQWLQRALEVGDDGIIGPETMDALKQADLSAIYRKVVAARARFFGRIITDDHSQAVFAAGWMKRLSTFIELAPA